MSATLTKDNLEEYVLLQIENHADLNIKDANNKSLLHYAAEYELIDVTKLLLHNNAEPIDEKTKILKLEMILQTHKEENERLKYELNLLETHIACKPDGPEFKKAQERFENKNY